VLAICSWWVAWIGLLPFSTFGVGTLVILGLCCRLFYRFRDGQIKLAVNRQWLISFLIWLVVFIAFALLTASRPEIMHTEKLADFHYLRAIMDSATIPPPDTWFSGEPIRYYYFGYTIFAAAGLLACIDAPFVYNLAIATIPAISAPIVYALATKLGGDWRKSGLAVLFTFVGGNLFGALQYWFPEVYGRFWYWDASRAVEHAITEFPFFSTFLGDLHPHFMAIPAVLLFLAVIFTLICGEFSSNRRAVIVSGFVVGLGCVVNTWNMPIMVTLVFLAWLFRLLDKNDGLKLPWAGAVKMVVATVALAALFFLPHYLYSTSPPQTIRWLPLSVNTPLLEFVRSWGLIWLPVWVGLICCKDHLRYLKRPKCLVVVALILLGGFFLKGSVATVMLATTVVAVDLLLSTVTGQRLAERITLVLVAVSAGMMFGTEILYVDDIFGGDFRRINTVFKLSYLLYMTLPLAIVGFWTICRKRLVGYVVVCCVLCGLVYPLGVVFQQADSFARSSKSLTLNGFRFFETDTPGQWQLANWIRTNLLDKDAIVLEAIDRSHAWGGRIAAYSGVSSPLNWSIVQQTVRGGFVEIEGRQADLAAFYAATDSDVAEKLLRLHGVTHFVVSPYEIKQYNIVLDFSKHFKLIYEFASSRLYAVD
jgi:YYY domain-containing protein